MFILIIANRRGLFKKLSTKKVDNSIKLSTRGVENRTICVLDIYLSNRYNYMVKLLIH